MASEQSRFSKPNSVIDERPRDASTVILMRKAQKGPEVFLVKRHGKSAFMGGAYVFPGGKVDPDDRDALLSKTQAERCLSRLDETPGSPLSLGAAVGFYVAAARELFEEAGVLLAKGELDVESKEGRARLFAWRQKLQKEEATFAQFLSEEKLELATETLLYWAHWITPSAERRRYDTRFFIVELPKGQVAAHDERETVAQVWMRPREALKAHDEGRIFLPPPTQRNLEELESGMDAVVKEGVQALAAQRYIFPILPKLTTVDNKITILLPWDPLYEETDGASYDLHYEAVPPGPSRIVIETPGRPKPDAARLKSR